MRWEVLIAVINFSSNLIYTCPTELLFMKQNHISKETMRHWILVNHENFTSGQLFLANKPAVGPEKLLFPQILGSTGNEKSPSEMLVMLFTSWWWNSLHFLTHDCSLKLILHIAVLDYVYFCKNSRKFSRIFSRIVDVTWTSPQCVGSKGIDLWGEMQVAVLQ